MLRRFRSIGIALAVTAVGVVALPAVGVRAAPLPPTVVLTSNPPANADGLVVCEEGTYGLTFDVSESTDPNGEFLYSEFTTPWGVREGPTIGFICDFPGTIEISVRVYNLDGGSATAKLRARAKEAPTAVISFQGKPQGPERLVSVGPTITFGGELSYDPEDGPVTYEWSSSTDTIKGDPHLWLTDVRCESERPIKLALKVTDQFGLTGTTSLTLNCILGVTATFTPEPAGPGLRTKVALGTAITFETTPSRFSTLEWRTTGVSGVASTERRYTRTFDKAGNIGVELTETSPGGQYKRWAGYTVLAPPTVSVTPAPPGLTDRMTVVAGSKITFDGSGSRSSDGSAVTNQWRTTGISGVVSRTNSYTRTFDTPGLFGVELIVTDEVGQTAKRWVGLTVVPADPPVVSVTPAPPGLTDRMPIKVGSTITFDGRASASPAGGALTYQWRTTGVAGVVATTNTYTRRFDTVGNFGVQLTVTDASGQQATRWVGLTVEP